MSMRRKVTGALAWAGLVIVIAVPAAELVSSRLVPMFSGATANKVDAPAQPPAVVPAAPAPAATVSARQTTAPATEVAAPPPAAKPEVDSNDTALNAYLSSGRKLPDYLTAGKSKGDAAPSSAAPAAESAAIPPTDEVGPVATATTDAAPPPNEPPAAASADWPVLDTAAPADSAAPIASAPPAADAPGVASTPPVSPVPLPAKARPKPVATPTITENDLRDWKSGSLEDYLKQRGLLSGGTAAGN